MARGGGVDSSKAAEAMEKGISMVKASLNV
jgi:hypothetical protein